MPAQHEDGGGRRPCRKSARLRPTPHPTLFHPTLFHPTPYHRARTPRRQSITSMILLATHEVRCCDVFECTRACSGSAGAGAGLDNCRNGTRQGCPGRCPPRPLELLGAPGLLLRRRRTAGRSGSSHRPVAWSWPRLRGGLLEVVRSGAQPRGLQQPCRGRALMTGEPSGCLNNAPCSPCTRHGA
jgi:hypothetical protein